MKTKNDNLKPPGEDEEKTPEPDNLHNRLSHHYRRIRKILNITETRKAIVRNELLENSTPREEYYALILFSCAIATFGLIANSEVVTIGSQLVDPIMSPILALAVATNSGLQRMSRQSIQSILQGMVMSIILSILISFLFYRLPYGPNAHIPETVLLRTSATLLDLGIALVGGTAAAYALAHPQVDNALPGVAIATALMPPLCTIGFGIAFLDSGIALGAVLQFLTNLTAILFAGIVTFRLLGFNPLRREESKGVSKNITASLVIVTVISTLLAIFTWNSVSEARIYDRVRNAIITNVESYSQVDLIDLTIIKNGNTREITATIRTSKDLNNSEVKKIQDILTNRLNQEVSLELITVPMQVITP